jgi:uncharacterized membrane protein YphA (DoxX/SURF4 family)
MNAGGTPVPGGVRAVEIFALLARWFLGGLFLYMGLSKALHPVEFLKLVRQYDLLHHHLLLNFVASTLPWFEIFCGFLLLLGVAVRGAAVMLVAMLVPFTWAVLARALDIHTAGKVAFCAIKFDCGCGAGEVIICRKLAENAGLTALSAALVFLRAESLCLRPALFRKILLS